VPHTGNGNNGGTARYRCPTRTVNMAVELGRRAAKEGLLGLVWVGCGLNRPGWLERQGVQAGSGCCGGRARAVLRRFRSCQANRNLPERRVRATTAFNKMLAIPGADVTGVCSPRPRSWCRCGGGPGGCAARAAGPPARSTTGPPAAGGTWTWAPPGWTCRPRSAAWPVGAANGSAPRPSPGRGRQAGSPATEALLGGGYSA
jgi:hypothetical protein